MAFRGRGSDLFDSMEREFEEMNRLMDRMFAGFRQWDWSQVPTDQPIYYGVSVEVGPDGIPRVQQFGNVRPGAEGVLEGGVREPFTTTILDEEKNQVRVTAELPGVTKESVKLEGHEEGIIIRAEGPERKYEKTVRLSVPVNPDTAKAKYNNGVLEVTLDLKRPIKPKGRDIKID